jgi:hypothetical protein
VKPHNLANRFRQHRMRKFLELVPMDRKVRIIDLGGTAAYWRALPALYGLANVEITVMNLDQEPLTDRNLTVTNGDACATGLADNSYDIVHSNSVIEHVGDWPNMEAMAREVRRLAPAYFIQTPNYWFPIEPHYKLPFVQFLPRPIRNRVRDAIWPGDSIELLNGRQMRRLFPDAELWRERVFGLTKSLVAIRN